MRARAFYARNLAAFCCAHARVCERDIVLLDVIWLLHDLREEIAGVEVLWRIVGVWV